tara:strand:+ start:118 stop:378 length:261 start_codon:yes stop_codon:yes gene_type:complete
MAGQLTETEINIRKQTLSAELEKQKSALSQLEEQRTNITAQMYATTGAIQQCDLFLKQLNGGNEDVTSSIPSEPEDGSSNIVTAMS